MKLILPIFCILLVVAYVVGVQFFYKDKFAADLTIKATSLISATDGLEDVSVEFRAFDAFLTEGSPRPNTAIAPLNSSHHYPLLGSSPMASPTRASIPARLHVPRMPKSPNSEKLPPRSGSPNRQNPPHHLLPRQKNQRPSTSLPAVRRSHCAGRFPTLLRNLPFSVRLRSAVAISRSLVATSSSTLSSRPPTGPMLFPISSPSC